MYIDADLIVRRPSRLNHRSYYDRVRVSKKRVIIHFLILSRLVRVCRKYIVRIKSAYTNSATKLDKLYRGASEWSTYTYFKQVHTRSWRTIKVHYIGIRRLYRACIVFLYNKAYNIIFVIVLYERHINIICAIRIVRYY